MAGILSLLLQGYISSYMVGNPTAVRYAFPSRADIVIGYFHLAAWGTYLNTSPWWAPP